VRRLEIQNLAIIDRLELSLESGLNVFTGETGAGKSIIVDAIWLLTGARADAELVRRGEDALLVTGFWEDLTLSRRVQSNGRSTARIDGEVISNRELAERSTELVTVHWQHAAQALLEPKYHRELLDAGLPSAAKNTLESYRETHRAHAETVLRLEALREGERDRARRFDLLSYQLREIDEANLNAFEEEPLRKERERLVNSERIAADTGNAVEALEDADTNAVGLLADAARALASAGRYDPAAAQLAQDLREALSSVQAVAGEARDMLDRLEAEPGELDRIEGRLALLERLKAKYGATLAEVLEYANELRLEAGTLERAELDATELEAQIAPLHNTLGKLAKALSDARADAAKRLAPQLEKIVRSLGMPKAQLEFTLEPLSEPGTHGTEEVEIRFSANAGEGLGSLSKIASGGELSTVLGSSTPSVIFDEVDAGIGGQAAIAVASELERLADKHQVLVVTHLAQIAARADHHFKVSKHEIEGRTRVTVEQLDGEPRVLELARMLSGSDSKAAIEHARELLGARRDKVKGAAGD
jgi:DNA repair protein RecN (Recombination protein N)